MISWNINFSCDNEEIDKQHKKLIEIIENIVAIISKKEYNLNNLLDVTTELDNYIEQHLRYEEELMLRYNYPHKEVHIQQHDLLRQRMSQLNIFDVNTQEKYFCETLEYLVNWLSEHIVGTDKKLGSYLLGKLG